MQSNLKPPVQHKHGINFGFKSILRWEVLKLIPAVNVHSTLCIKQFGICIWHNMFGCIQSID
uniref:Uncharacterized protein n=1 Tax=Anguilla anguilla TaxID=7936 RepID=A0A0E9SJ42_ANGAN